MGEDCPTFRLRDPLDSGCDCGPTPYSGTASTTFYGRVSSGAGQTYQVDLYEQGPLMPATKQVTVSCPDLDVAYVLAPGYPLLVMLLNNQTYLSLPTLVFNNSSLPFIVE